jgi:hypothetical protein
LNKEYYKPTGQEILIACNGNYVGLAQDFISINCDYLVIARAIFDERRLSIPFDKLWNMLPLDIINFRDGNKYNTCWFDPTGSQSPFMVTLTSCEFLDTGVNHERRNLYASIQCWQVYRKIDNEHQKSAVSRLGVGHYGRLF